MLHLPLMASGNFLTRRTFSKSILKHHHHIARSIPVAVLVLLVSFAAVVHLRPALFHAVLSSRRLMLVKRKAEQLRRTEVLRYLPADMLVSPTWRTDTVPQIVHFVVPSNSSRWKPVWQHCHETWKQHFPDHALQTWDDSDIEGLVHAHYPTLLAAYQAFPRQIQRADFARYLILNWLGGVYADSDYQCVQNFAHLLPPGRVSIAESPHGGEGVQNSLMASPPLHPFWRFVVREALAGVYVDDVVLSTGPRAVLHAINNAPADYVHLLPRQSFAQWPENAKSDTQLYRPQKHSVKVYAIHLGTGSWETKILQNFSSELLSPAPS